MILESPFEAFSRYERSAGLPDGLIRQMNATNPDTNAWARMERNEVGVEEFFDLFEAEAAGAGHTVDGRAVLASLSGALRPAMAEAVRRCAARLPTGLVTNNFVAPGAGRPEIDEVLALFHIVVESSKVGLRKPDPAIYSLACTQLGVAPEETVFLDDLGINLKPARAMGMTTIKVIDPGEALDALEEAVGFKVTAP